MSQPIFNIAPITKILLLAYIFLWIAFAFLLPDGDAIFEQLAFVPALLSAKPYTLITYQFLHAGILHLLVNSAMLAALGNAVEDTLTPLRYGRLRFIVFYLLCGALAGAGEWLVHPRSTESLVGASGAISGLLGAILFIQSRRNKTPFTFALQVVILCAVMALVGYFNIPDTGNPIAWVAHIAGFLAGIALWPLFTLKSRTN